MNQSGQTRSASMSHTRASGPSSAAWRAALLALSLVLASILALYADTLGAMVTIWYRSETFTHAFVVPPIVLWLVWRRRQEIALIAPRPALWVLFAIAGVALFWLLGDLVAVNAVTQLAVTAMLVLAVPALLGIPVALAIAFPLIFLFFAVPIGEFLMPLLMEWTADFTVAALRLSGIPVVREGLQFVIPSGSWSVVEACSGVRYLIASLTVGTLFAYLNYQSTQRRVLFIIVSALVPIVANWLRAYMIVLLGHLSGNTLAVGVDHLIYGWAFFGVVIMLMFLIGARWSEPEKPLAVGDSRSPTQSTALSGSRLWIATFGMLAIVALPVVARWAIERDSVSGAPQFIAPAALAPGWQVADASLIGFKPSFQNPSAEIHTSYKNAAQVVGLYLGFYRQQDYSRKLVSSENVLVISKDPVWSRVAGSTRLATFGQRQATVRAAELRSLPVGGSDRSGRLVVWQIYWINGTLTANDYVAKIYSALYRLMGRGDDSAVIIVYADKASTGGAEATLESFLSANYDAIDALLRQTKASK